MNKPIDQFDYLLGEVLEEEKITVGGVEPITEKEYRIVAEKPDDFRDINEKYIELYIRWLLTNYNKAEIKKRKSVHDKQMDILLGNNDQLKGQMQRILGSMCHVAITVLDGKEKDAPKLLEGGIKMVSKLVNELKDLRDNK